jgi:hypothetical protein
MRKLLLLVPVVLVLTGCAAQEPADPMSTCVDVSVEYSIAESKADAVDLCDWLQDHETLLGGSTFGETFSDPASAREWAEAEVAKSN